MQGVQIAPRTYYAWRRRGPSKRALWEPRSPRCWPGSTSPATTAVDDRSRCTAREDVGPPEPGGHRGGPVHRGAVDAPNGWQGVTRRDRPRTTITDPGGPATRPGRPAVRGHRPEPAVRRGLHLRDPMRAAGLHRVHDRRLRRYHRRLAGHPHRERRPGQASFADAIEYRPQGHPVEAGAVHHSDAGSHTPPCVRRHSPRPTSALDRHRRGRLRQRPGRDHDRPLQDRVHPGRSPFNPDGFTTLSRRRTATAAWVHWFNTSRLMHRLGRRPPAEAEAEYYAQQTADQHVGK